MEILLSSGAKTSQPVPIRENVGIESLRPVFRADKDVRGAAAAKSECEVLEQKEHLRDVLKKTGDLLSMGDRSLKFELIEAADLYQLQVIDTSSGKVVRKIPPDEVLKLISYFREQLTTEILDHVDTWA